MEGNISINNYLKSYIGEIIEVYKIETVNGLHSYTGIYSTKELQDSKIINCETLHLKVENIYSEFVEDPDGWCPYIFIHCFDYPTRLKFNIDDEIKINSFYNEVIDNISISFDSLLYKYEDSTELLPDTFKFKHISYTTINPTELNNYVFKFAPTIKHKQELIQITDAEEISQKIRWNIFDQWFELLCRYKSCIYSSEIKIENTNNNILDGWAVVKMKCD